MYLITFGVLVGIFIPSLAIGEAEEPTTITSKTMTASGKDRKAIFQGSVKLTQGDLVVRSDVMVVFFKDEGNSEPESQNGNAGPSRQKVHLIEAKGKVRINKSAGKATCRHALYFKDEEKIVLTGSPIAWQEGTRVSGSKIIMYLKENRSEVEGGSRVIITE